MSATSRRSLAAFAEADYDGERLQRRLAESVQTLRLGGEERRDMGRATAWLLAVLDERGECTLQQRWGAIEAERWPAWVAGRDRLAPTKRWTWGTAALVLSRAVRPGWIVLPRARLSQWLDWLPADDRLRIEFARLQAAVAGVAWSAPEAKRRAALLGLRILLAGGQAVLEQITDEDLQRVPVGVSDGINTLDAVLCDLGVLDRTPQQGAQRRLRRGRLSPAELIAGSRIPDRFRAVHQLYLETYAQRISDVYATARHKHNSLEHLRHTYTSRTAQASSTEAAHAHRARPRSHLRSRPRRTRGSGPLGTTSPREARRCCGAGSAFRRVQSGRS